MTISTFVPQVGGNHYGGGDFQHWDFVVCCGIDYLSAVATKYLARWREKGGIEDLRKARSYVDKQLFACHFVVNYRPTHDLDAVTQNWPRYLEAYNLAPEEKMATWLLFTSKNTSHIESALSIIDNLIAKELLQSDELKKILSSINPSGWQNFVFEGQKEGMSFFRCNECKERFWVPADSVPAVSHFCEHKKVLVPTPDSGEEPDSGYVNQG